MLGDAVIDIRSALVGLRRNDKDRPGFERRQRATSLEPNSNRCRCVGTRRAGIYLFCKGERLSRLKDGWGDLPAMRPWGLETLGDSGGAISCSCRFIIPCRHETKMMMT